MTLSFMNTSFFFSPQKKESEPNAKTGTAASGSMDKIKKSLARNVNHSAHTVLLRVLTLAK